MIIQSYVSVFLHLVWSTKNREPWFSEQGKKKLYGYIKSILKKEGVELVAIGGTANHIHILIRTHNIDNMKGLLRKIKSYSSGFVNRMNKVERQFNWQNGYGMFSERASGVTKLKRYIWNQEEHHKNITFEEELELLSKF